MNILKEQIEEDIDKVKRENNLVHTNLPKIIEGLKPANNLMKALLPDQNTVAVRDNRIGNINQNAHIDPVLEEFIRVVNRNKNSHC